MTIGHSKLSTNALGQTSMPMKEQRAWSQHVCVLLAFHMRCRPCHPCEDSFGPQRSRSVSGVSSSSCSLTRRWYQSCQSAVGPTSLLVIVLSPPPRYWVVWSSIKISTSCPVARLCSIWSSLEREEICESFINKSKEIDKTGPNTFKKVPYDMTRLRETQSISCMKQAQVSDLHWQPCYPTHLSKLASSKIHKFNIHF